MPKPRSLRQALETALSANPDDLASHLAYADYLQEQGDPRGEFIQIQLALEEESRTAAERRKLRQREKKLLDQHGRAWLGGLAPFLLDGRIVNDWGGIFFGADHRMADFRFRRGWLDRLHVYFLSLSLARTLKKAKEARLLRELVLETIQDTEGDAAEPEDNIPAGERWPGLHPLVGCTVLANVRHFRFGLDQGDDYRQFDCHVHSSVLLPFIRQMPRLEELILFTSSINLTELFSLSTLRHLRVLQVYHGEQVHRLHLLTTGKTFHNLTHLLLHPHFLAWVTSYVSEDEADGYREEDGYLPLSEVRALLRSRKLPNLAHLRLRLSSMGDEGCEEIVRSDILKRLKTLDLRHGRITDEGVRILAACPDLRNLEWLDLDRNALTARGIEMIKAVGIPVRVEDQQTAAEVAEQQYLREGEFE